MDRNLLDLCYKTALDTVREAGHIVTEGFSKTKTVETKTGFFDLVTEYDQQVEQFIKKRITKKFPDHKFLGEESSGESILKDDLTWVLDPIDGTNNFVNGYPESAISLALTLNKEPIIGIVYCPMNHKMYSGCQGKGSFFNGERIYTSKITSLNKALVGLEVSLGGKSKKLLDTLSKRSYASIQNSIGIRCIGSAALGLCYVAHGMWQVYHTEGLMPWDTAAGVLLIKEAGGVVCDSLGEKFDINNSNILAACNKELANEIVSTFKKLEDQNS